MGLRVTNQRKRVIFSSFGFKSDTAKPTEYKLDENLKNALSLDIKTDKYLNMTDIYLKNFENKNAEFVFFSTEAAKNSQLDILKDFKKDKYELIIFDEKKHEELLNKLIKKIQDIEKNHERTDIIIDITHGFRDTTSVGLLAGLIEYSFSREDKKDNKMNFIFAKEFRSGKDVEFYTITSLNNYADVLKLSFILNTFKNTLKIIKSDIEHNFYKELVNLSNSIFENNIKEIKKAYENLLVEKENISKNPNDIFFALLPMIEDILNELKEFENFSDGISHKDYFILCRLYLKKSYALNAAGFMLEGLQIALWQYFMRNIPYDYPELQRVKNMLFLCIEGIKDENKGKDDKQKNLAKTLANYKYTVQEKTLLFNLLEYRKNVAKHRNNMSHINPKMKDNSGEKIDVLEELNKILNQLMPEIQTIKLDIISAEAKANIKAYLAYEPKNNELEQ